MIDLAIQTLTEDQRQLDQDGIWIGVSRQALEEALAHIKELEKQRDEVNKIVDEARDAILTLKTDVVRIGNQRDALFNAGFNVFMEAKPQAKRTRGIGTVPISWRYLDVLKNCLSAVQPANPELK